MQFEVVVSETPILETTQACLWIDVGADDIYITLKLLPALSTTAVVSSEDQYVRL